MKSAEHYRSSLVDARTKQRVCMIVSRVGVARAKLLLGVSDHTLEALRFNGAMRGNILARIVARLDELDRTEAAAE